MNLRTATKWFFFILILAVVGFLVTAEVAHAQSGPPDNRPPDNRPPDRTGDVSVDVLVESGAVVSESHSNASAASESVSDAYAEGGSATATGGNASITNNVSLFGTGEGGAGQQSAGGGNSIVSINEAKRPDDIKIRNVPSISAPDVFPTVSCFKGTSFSLGVPGAGGSFGGGKIDEDCVKREYIRLAFVMGAIERAVFMWCKQPAVWEDFGSVEECLQFEADQGLDDEQAAVIEQQLRQFVTEPELQAADEQIMAQVDVRVSEVDERVQGIEDRLNANAAAARKAAAEREAWKADLAQRYLATETSE